MLYNVHMNKNLAFNQIENKMKKKITFFKLW
jgi:hypothetical protein